MMESFSGTHPYDSAHVADSVELDWFGQDLDEALGRTLAIKVSERVTEALESGRCPRCGDPLDPDRLAGSRLTACRCIPICPACGGDEANQAILGRPYSRAWEWPIGKGPRTKRAKRVGGTLQRGVLAGDQLMSDAGVTKVSPRPHSGGWAEYGKDDAR